MLDVAARADQAFASIADQSRYHYLIGFMPKAHAQPGEYRRVSVRVKRAGARVSSRTGFALSDASAHMDRQQALQRAMAAPFAQQGLTVQYTTYTLRGNTPGTQTVVLSLETSARCIVARGACRRCGFRCAIDCRWAGSGER